MRTHAFVRMLLLGAVFLALGSRASRAQSIWFTQVPPQGFAGSSGAVQVSYHGVYGDAGWCDSSGEICSFYPYEHRVVLGTFWIMVNGSDRTSIFTVAEREYCAYDPTHVVPWECDQYGTADGTPSFATSGTNTIVASVESVNYTLVSATYTWLVPATAQVTASPASITVGGGRSAQSAGFTVTNSGGSSTRLLLSAQCSGGGLQSTPACLASLGEMYLKAGESAPARVIFNTQPAAGSGTATLIASNPIGGATLGSASATITVTAPPLAIVTVPAFQRGATFERSLCPTFAVAPGVATQCGAVRVAHALPSVRTYGKAYAPTLAYYGDNAKGTYLVVNVTLPPSTPIPGTVVMNVFQVSPTGVRGPLIAARSYAGSSWNTNRSMRLSTGDLGGPYNTINTYDVEVQLDGTSAGPYVRGQVAPVNRASSAFGNGWNLLGLEQLVTNQLNGTALWIGGDGSTRQYTPVSVVGNITTYAAPAVDRPDSLYHDIGTHEWRRALPHGANVFFDETGHHVRTVNRFGRATTFVYEAGTNGRVTTITVPGGLSYQVDYSNSSTVIVIAQGGRVVRLNGVLGSNGNLTVNNIVDPDGSTESFSCPIAAPGCVLTGWTDRRGTHTDFSWEAGGASNDLGSAVTTVAGQARIPSFSTVWGRGAASGAPAEDASVADYTYDGPRVDVADVASIWTDTLGAVVRTRDALGRETVVEHGDPRFPGLPTKAVNSASGYTVRAAYDARGRVAAKTEVNPHDDGRDATTLYTWDPTWDEVTSITMPEGETTNFGVDFTTGNRIWEENPNVAGSRTTYRYYAAGLAAGLPRAVQYPAGNNVIPVDSIDAYDGLGNVARLISPNLYLTTVSNDGLGRTTGIHRQVTPGDAATMQVDSTVYDIMSHPVAQQTWGPALGTVGPQWVWTYNYYSSRGDLDSTSRVPSSGSVLKLTNRWRYDALGRVGAEIAPDGLVDSTAYDLAGNDVSRVTRDRDTLQTTYDALNRPLTRATLAKSYPQRQSGVCRTYACLSTDRFPLYPLTTSGSLTTIPAQTAQFTYDPITGQVQEADNADAQVARTYDRSGALKSETQIIRTVGSLFRPPHPHVYTMTYGRDRNGRVTSVQLPTAVQPSNAGGAGTSIQYVYDPNTGALAEVHDALGYVTTATYNARGLRERLGLPGASVAEWYDAEGQLTSSLAGSQTSIPLRNATFTYDARGKMKTMNGTTGPRDTIASTYSGLGHLVQSSNTSWGYLAGYQTFSSNETFVLSPLGDIVSGSTTTNYAYTSGGAWAPPNASSLTSAPRSSQYDTVGRLRWQKTGTRTDQFWYDSAGNTKYMFAAGGTDNLVAEERASYYDGAGQLRATELHVVSNWTQQADYLRQYRRVFEEYRYDAFGRRVWVRSRKDCTENISGGQWFCGVGTVRRIIWDGSAELAEIQQPGGNGASYDDMESDGALVTPQSTPSGDDPNPLFGTALYAYGMNGTDQPVTVTRLFYQDQPVGQAVPTTWPPFSFTPLWNAVGAIDNFVYPDGKQSYKPLGREVKIGFPQGWFAYYRSQYAALSWHGSLVEDKRDASGLHYRRNRSYDPMTGRFTQEDPIGLAGGMNAYGFASGDPVNFSDPFGLCAWHEMSCWNDKLLALGSSGSAIGRFAGAAASLALELTGAVSVDENARGAAGGSRVAMAGLAFDIGINAIPGGGEGKAALSRLMKDAVENPGAWRTIGAFTEAATRKDLKGGLSIQRIIENQSGDRLVEHTLVDKSGKAVDQHLRPTFKPRDVDVP